MKNITLIGVNFAPEDSSTGLYSTQMMQYLSDSGHNIDVVTGFPYYPQWEIAAEYQEKSWFIDEQLGDIKIHRYKQYVPENPNFSKRILHLLDFTFGSCFNLFKVKKCDVVIAIVPFTTSILLGLILAKLRGAKLWVHIQDFEFDAAKESGLVSGGRISNSIFSFLMKVEGWFLTKADKVSTISNSMIDKLASKTNVPNYLFPNWVDPDDINPQAVGNHEFLRSDRFKILYSGNIGAKQDWDFFLKIAQHYQGNNEIEFIVVGAGANKQSLIEKTVNLNNIKHHDPVDFADLSSLLCSADLHILFQKNNVIDTVMPSKILGMMASAKPSIVTGNLRSESAKLFKSSAGGYFFDSDELESVIKQIDLLRNDGQLSENTGKSAREYIISHFSKEQVLSQFEEEISQFA